MTLAGICLDDAPIMGRNSVARLKEERGKLHFAQKYLRGLYCGETLCAEALSIARAYVQPIFSNVAKQEREKLSTPLVSMGHCFVDLGDDSFTRGRPHPMIDPSIRGARILQEAADPETAVLLLDFVLGYGAHVNPVGVVEEPLRVAREMASRSGRHLAIVGYVCGTDLDKQGLYSQIRKLEHWGVLVAKSNAHAVRMACQIIAGGH